MTDAELLKQALERFDVTSESDKTEREYSIQDTRFVNTVDGQWEERITEKRGDRPKFTINKISPAIDQLVGDQRQSRIGIDVLYQGGGEEDLSKIYKGLIRSIERLSHAENAYDNAYEEAVTGGYGGFRIITKFNDDDSFEQDIEIKSIESAASTLYFDPNATEYDKRDAKYGFLITEMGEEEFKENYPDSTMTDFSHDVYFDGWHNDKNETVRIAEYWYKEPKKKRIGLLSNGYVVDLEEEKNVLDELASEGITIIREREVDSYNLYMAIISGAEVLERSKKYMGKYIPLVPVYGKTVKIENERLTRGIVRPAIDSQRILNYTTSQIVEIGALSLKDPFFMTPGQIEGLDGKVKKAIENNHPVVLYNPDSTPGVVPPYKAGGAQIQPALVQQQAQASLDIQATTGIESASLGQNVSLKSGKAIRAEQAMGDRGSYVYQDNLQKSISFAGTILVDLIPRIYDTERVETIIGSDDKEELVTINRVVTDRQTGEEVTVNDLSQGKYAVSAKAGASFSSKKEESLNQLISITQDSPELKMLVMDLIAKNSEINDVDELTERIRALQIKQGVVEPTDEEKEKLGLNQPPKPDPMKEALVESVKSQSELTLIQAQKVIADIRNKEADTENKNIQANKDSVSALADLIETLIKKRDAGFPLTPEDIETLQAQQALIQEVQIDVLENQEVAGSTPLQSRQTEQPPPNR